MKKILLLFLIVGLTFSMSAQQQIDLIGIGINGQSGGNLEIDPDLTNVTSVHLGVVYKDVFGIDPIGSIQFTDDDPDHDFIAAFMDVDEERSNGDYAHVGTFTTDFIGVGTTGETAIVLDLTRDINYVQSFYAFVYRTIPDASYYSVANLTTVFFYHNGSIDPFEFHMPITPVDAPRNVTVKVPVSELDYTDRMVIIDISYDDGNGNTHFESHEETTWDAESSFFLGNYLLPDVPGTVSDILVSIYSPSPDGDGMNGDSFVVTGIVVDVDNVPPSDDPEPECADCDGGINSLDLKYLGTETDVTIRIYEKKVEPNKLIETFYNVDPDDVLSFVGLKENNYMGSKIRITIDDGGFTEIHTSCSQDIFMGMIYDNLYEIMAGNSVDGGALCPYVPGECGECDGQITYLNVKYTGTEAADIKIYEGKVEPNKLMYEFDNVQPDGSFSFVGLKNHGKMGAKIRLTIDGEPGYIEIHTSCSQDIYIGSTYEGTYEILDGTSHEGGPLCVITEGDPDPECAECEGQITYLDVKYTGTEAADIKIYEGKVRPDKLMYEFDNVQPDGSFSFVGLKNHGKMGAKIRLTIEGESGYIEIHTSCSQDIYIGSTYEGTYEILDGTSHEGGPLCVITEGDPDPECDDCDGGMTYLDLKYTGTETAHIKVYKDKVEPNKLLAEFPAVVSGGNFSFVGTGPHEKMGAKIRITIEGESGYTQIHTSCSQDIYVGSTYESLYEVLEGTSRHGGPLCDIPEGDPDPDCAECDGQITYLDVKYTGTEAADITIYEGKVQDDKFMYLFEDVQPGGSFSFVGLKNHDKMGAKIRLTIEGESGYTEIHTSCSQDIYIGSTYDGLYEILDGTSHEGGPLCGIPANKSSSNVTLNELKDMVIYPNPMSSMGTIEYVATHDGHSSIEIYNIMGEKVGVLFSGRVIADNRYQVTLDANSLSKGMYIVVITNESTTYKQKLFIAR